MSGTWINEEAKRVVREVARFWGSQQTIAIRLWSQGLGQLPRFDYPTALANVTRALEAEAARGVRVVTEPAKPSTTRVSERLST